MKGIVSAAAEDGEGRVVVGPGLTTTTTSTTSTTASKIRMPLHNKVRTTALRDEKLTQTPQDSAFRNYGSPSTAAPLPGTSDTVEEMMMMDESTGIHACQNQQHSSESNLHESLDTGKNYVLGDEVKYETKKIIPLDSSQRRTSTTYAESAGTSITSLNLSAMNCNFDSRPSSPTAENREDKEQATKHSTGSNESEKNEMESTGNMSETDGHDDDEVSKQADKLLTRVLHCIRIFRTSVGKVVNNDKVQFLIVCLIVVNALLMGVATLDFVTGSEQVSKWFENTDTAFLIVFTVEIAMQLIYRGLWHVLTDAWLCFDFIIVVASWSFESSSMQILRSFRIFRAFRLITRLKVLQNLVQALFDVAPSVMAIVSLLLLILYIFAVLCTELFGSLYDEGILDYNYFGRLDTSLFTLFQMVTLDWADIVRQVADKYYYAWPLFSTFLVITSFILYSLVVAVVCDAVMVGERKNDKDDTGEMKKQIDQLQKRVSELTANQVVILRMLQDSMRQLENVSRDDGIFLSLNDDGAFFLQDGSASTQSSPGTSTQERWRGTLVDAPLTTASPPATFSTTSFELNLTM